MQAPEQLIERIKEAARKSESKPFPGMDRVWDKIEERLDEEAFQQNEMPFPGMDKVWGKIEERLDEQQSQKRVIPFRKLSIAAAVLLLLSLGTFFFQQNRTADKDHTQTYVQQQRNTSLPHDAVNISSGPVANDIGTDFSVVAQRDNRKVRVNSKRKGDAENADHPSLPALAFIQTPVLPDEEQGSYFSRKIKGHVTDQNGESLAGAVVLAKESKTIAITDVDGNYEIVVGGNMKTLEVSGAGMTTKLIAIDPAGNVAATALEPDPGVLADISVYDKSNRQSYTASVVEQEAGVLGNRPLTDIDKAIAGELPGVRIKKYGGAITVSTDLVMGGMSSGGFGRRPLVVIDGTQYNGGSFALKYAELESLTILKDESAKAVYGSKGINGVILIKTKTGKGYAEPKTDIFKKVRNIFKREK